MKKKIIAILVVLILVIIALFVSKNLILNAKTDIPKLYFTGNISKMESKSDVRDILVSYSDGETAFKGFAEIKVQGTSSLRYEKKNYTIKFYNDEEHKESMAIDMGWGEQNKYCLKANWIDKTHARNVVTARIVTQLQKQYNVLDNAPRNGAIDGFPVEIYNNGEFLGLYTFNIPKDEWQFNMDGDNENHIVLGGEGWDDANLFLDYPDFETWSVEVGDESPETLEKANRLFDFVINSTDEEFKANFEEYLDLDATLNYFVLSEFAFLRDNRAKNMLLATYDGKVWYPSLYDLDSSWGTDVDGESKLEYILSKMNMSRSNLFARVEKNFSKELVERYFTLRETLLSKEHILNEFNSFRNEIPELTFLKEKIRWGLNIPGFEYSQIEEYLDAAVKLWDERYQKLSQNN